MDTPLAIVAGMSLDKRLGALGRALATDLCALLTDEPALVNHGSIAALVATLDSRETPWPKKEALTRALVREHRRGTSSRPGAVLLVAYGAALVSLRQRLDCATFDHADLDQIVVNGFLEAVVRFDDVVCPDRVVMHLHQRTRDVVFRVLAHEKRAWNCVDEIARFPDIDCFDVPAHREPLDDDEIEGLADDLRAIVGDALDAEKVELIIGTCLRGIPLKGTVLDLRDYERAKRSRRKSLAILRVILTERIGSAHLAERVWLRGGRA